MHDFELRCISNLTGQRKVVLKGRKEGVSGNLSFDQGQVKVGAEWQGLPVNLRSAADEDLAGTHQSGQFVQAADRAHAGEFEIVAAQHNGVTVGQGFADGLEGLSAHDEDMSGGGGFKPFEILGQVPGNLVFRADHAVERHGGDGLEGVHWKKAAFFPPIE